MKRLIYILLLAGILLCPIPAEARQVLELATGNLLPISSLQAPTKTVTNTSDTTKVTYEFNNVSIAEDPDFNGEWLFYIDGFGDNDIQGEPAYLMNSDSFLVPDGCKAVLSIDECSYKEFSYKLGPVRMQEYDSYDGDEPLSRTVAVQPYDGLLPKAFVSLGTTESYRGRCIQYVRVTPIQYDYANEKVRIITKLSYSVTMKKESPNKIANDSRMNVFDDTFIESLCLNAGADTQDEFDSNEITPKDYLIVTTPKFETEVKRFARWKKIMGYKTSIVSKSDWTVQTVKDSIAAQAEKHPNLYYLMIVGDFEDVPAKYYWDSYPKSYVVSDQIYACIDNDELPDVLMGRIPVSSAAEAQVVFDKIINYEKNPINYETFYNSAVHASYFQGDSLTTVIESRGYIQASEKARTLMIAIGKNVERIYCSQTLTPEQFKDGTLLPAELKKPDFAWDGTGSDISNAINKGAFYVFHRDHGSITSWSNPHFSVSEIDNLNNKRLLPVVFSINCSTGKFNEEVCFAESFIRKQDGGCVGIFGASDVSPTDINNDFTNELFKLISEIPNKGIAPGKYQGATYSLGEILTKGIANLISNSSLKDKARYERRIFHCFGDPSMIFLTSKPSSPNNVKINQSNDNLTVSTTTPDTEIVVLDEDNDEVSIYKQSSITLVPTSSSNLSVCIKAPGMRPVVYENIGSQSLHVQNETFENDREYNVNHIMIGEDLDEYIPHGKVEFTSGSVKLNGEVQIGRNVEIQKGVEFKITNH